MENYFSLSDSPYYNKYIIRINHEKFLFPNGTNGSYGVFIARLLNLDYADYLRYARDRLGAELIGKGKRYIIPYFENNETTRMFIKLLNKRMEYIMQEQEYPFEYEIKGGEVKRIPFEEKVDES